MLEFKKPELTDKPWIDDILSNNQSHANHSFANVYLWQDSLNTRIARVGDRLIIKFHDDGRYIYTFPIGRGDLKPAVDAIKADAAESGGKLFMCGISSSGIDPLTELYGGEFDLVPDEASFEYVYLASLLADPGGRKLHAKKNHINRFIEENDWSYEPIDESNLDDCRRLVADWMQINGGKLLGTHLDEEAALNRVFADYASLGFEGGILRSGARPVAFTMGEVVSGDTFVTHFEKAYADVNGAYPMINREFARHILRMHPEIKYINREEDMGIENLRRAKQSYCPELMVEKYVASWR